jgi:MYXO-CTERM domain-containing protein
MKSSEHISKKGGHHSLLVCLVVVLGLLSARSAFATEYYVSPTGSDSNPGTLASPFGTVQKGANTAAAGDTVWLRGGTYTITTPETSGSGIVFSKSGTSDTNRIKYWAYPGEVPKIDFSNMKISTSGYTMGITVSGNWLHFKGIEECCTTETTFANNGWDVSGSNDTFELLNMHNNQGNGIFMGTKSGGGNLILNCDGHDNYDPTTTQGQGQNADGFGVHYQTSGATTVIRGCRSWWNSDDGYDLINQEVPVTVENSWAFGCGFATYGTYSPSSGNGNGFKMGSSKTGVRHLVQNNVAWKNKANGFYANHSAGGNTWYNNTSFQNGTQYDMLASSWDAAGNRTDGVILTGTKVHIMRNNLGFPNKNVSMNGVDTQFNAWDLNIVPAAKDFLSITDPTVGGTGQAIETTSPALGPRQADGSLPNVDFMKLAAGSAMIDKGTDVGLPFVGAAPDLGAYEFGATGAAGATGSGGTTGAGGAMGAGGATGAGGAKPGDAGAGGSAGPRDGGLGGSTASLGSGGAIVVASGGSGTTPAGGAPGTGGGAVGGSVAGGSVASFGGDGTVGTGGLAGEFAASGGSNIAGSGAGGAAGGQSSTNATSSSGCSCAIGSRSRGSWTGTLVALLGALGLVQYRRRRR